MSKIAAALRSSMISVNGAELYHEVPAAIGPFF